MSGTSTTRIFRRSFHNHLLKKVEKLASRIAALGQCLLPHPASHNYHRNKALYYIGFRKGKISPFSKNSFYFQPAPSSQKALTHQAILTWQNDSIGKFAKFLYIQDFSRAKNEVSDKIFFENSQAVSSSASIFSYVIFFFFLFPFSFSCSSLPKPISGVNSVSSDSSTEFLSFSVSRK